MGGYVWLDQSSIDVGWRFSPLFKLYIGVNQRNTGLRHCSWLFRKSRKRITRFDDRKSQKEKDQIVEYIKIKSKKW